MLAFVDSLPSNLIAEFQFEELISSTIEETKDIPEIISETGKIGMPHKGTWCKPMSMLNLIVDAALQKLCAKSGSYFYCGPISTL